ncbi:transcriptional regulator with XRE-family HTH domain [Paraburkholderia sp. CI3]
MPTCAFFGSTIASRTSADIKKITHPYWIRTSPTYQPSNSQCTGKTNYSADWTVLPFHWERNLELAEVFGALLRERRIHAELTQEQLAFEANIRRNYVSMLELGQHQPTLTMLFALATALKCSPAELLAEVERKLKKARRSKKKTPTAIKTRVNVPAAQKNAPKVARKPTKASSKQVPTGSKTVRSNRRARGEMT